jgi:2-keto-4-pentenoate hydratase
MTVWARDEVRAAFAQQLQERRALVGAGAQPLGWKLGAGSPAAMAKLDIEGPLVGYLLEDRQIESGATASVAGWTNARIETEIAVRIGEQLAPGFTLSDCARAISAITLAFELVDVDAAGASAEEMLRRNVFNRAVVLGGWVAKQDVPPVSVALGDELVTDAVDPLAAVGDLAELVKHVAEVLAANETSLAPGSVILTGAVALPPPATPGQCWTASAPTLGQIAITIVG